MHIPPEASWLRTSINTVSRMCLSAKIYKIKHCALLTSPMKFRILSTFTQNISQIPQLPLFTQLNLGVYAQLSSTYTANGLSATTNEVSTFSTQAAHQAMTFTSRKFVLYKALSLNFHLSAENVAYIWAHSCYK